MFRSQTSCFVKPQTRPKDRASTAFNASALNMFNATIDVIKGSSKKRVGKQKYIAINVSRLECNNIVTFYPGVLWN